MVTTRKRHPRLGKKKMAVLLQKEGYTLSESYVGRVITDIKKRGVLQNEVQLSFHARTGRHHVKQVRKRTKQRRKCKQGMEVDAVVRFLNKTR